MQVHPSQISPGEPFDIFYFLRNPTDTATYYVQAVIHDVRTGAVLATTTLSASPVNPHLFTATIQAPADSTGIGRNIIAVASLYLDAGFTTKSQDYEEQEQAFLIRAIAPLFGGGGGIDYGTLREIVQEELQKAVKAIPKPETTKLPDMPFSQLLGAIGTLQREVNRIPKEDGDLTPLQDKLDAIQQAFTSLPQPEPLDLSIVTDAIDQLSQQLDQLPHLIASTAASLSKAQEASLRQLAFQLDAAMKGNIADALGNHQMTVNMPFPVSMQARGGSGAKPKQPDISSLQA